MESKTRNGTYLRLDMLVHPWHHHWRLLFIGEHMRKFTQSILGKGVTFTTLTKFRDGRGRIDFDRVEVDGIVVENDGYVATVRGWDGTMHKNVETSELVAWAESDNHDMPCLD